MDKVEITKDNYKLQIKKCINYLELAGDYLSESYYYGTMEDVEKTQKMIAHFSEFLGELLEFQKLHG
jgi:hypothetical protein